MRQAWNKKSPNTKRNAHRERERKEEERKSNSHTNAEDARGYRKHVCSYKPFVIATPHSFAHLRPAIHHRTAIGKKINKNSNDGQIIQGRAPAREAQVGGRTNPRQIPRPCPSHLRKGRPIRHSRY